MITIGATPPNTPAQTPARAANAVNQPSAVPQANNQKQKRDGREEDPDKSDPPHQDDPDAELSDEQLLNLVRAFTGKRGGVVDKKV